MTGKELFLDGNIKRTLLTNAVPALGGIMLLAINSVADGLFVSRLLGERALAGLTLASPFIIFQSSLATLVATGSSVLINRGLGSDDKRLIKHVFDNVPIVAICLAIINLAIYHLVGLRLLKLLSNDSQAIQYASQFFNLFSAGTIVVILSLCYGALIRSGGLFKRVSLHLLISLIANIALSLILIPSFGMGGCALAMLGSMLVYAVLNFRTVRQYYQLSFAIRYDFSIIKQIASIGLSSGLFQFSAVIRQTIIIAFIHLTVSGDVAWYGALSRILALAIIPAQAIVQSFQPMFITNLGAGQSERCRLILAQAGKYAFGSSLLVAIACGCGVYPIFSFYLNQPTISDAAYQAYFICISSIILYPVSSLSFVLLQSSGFHQTTTVIAALREVTLLLPIALLLSHLQVENAIYWAVITEVGLYTTIIFSVAWLKTNGLFRPAELVIVQ